MTTQPLFGEPDLPARNTTSFNPFESVAAASPEPQIIPEAPREPQRTSRKSNSELLTEALLNRRAEKVAILAAGIASHVSRAARRVLGDFWETFKGIVSQAVKMALFKFAIESCAMLIRTLLQTMLNMKMPLPSLDTKEIMYNMGTNGSSGPTNTQTTSGNPFANSSPFSHSAPAW